MTTRRVPFAHGWRLLLAALLLLAYLPGWAQPVPIRSLRELPLPKELRLASRPAPQAVLAPYEQFTGGSLTDFQGNGLAFTPSGSWRITNGQATTGTYQPDQLAELVSEPFRLDTALRDHANALMGFALYFDERYELETGHDYGSVYLQYQLPDQSWSAWTLLSQRTGLSPRTRITYLSLRDPALWHRQVRVKFSLQSDCATQFEGWSLDNVTLRQIVTTPEIRTALVPLPVAPPMAPPMVPFVPYRPGGLNLRTPINGLQRLFVPALDRLLENPCRLDVTYVINGSHILYNSIVQDLPQLVNNNLDELAQLLQEARQTSCKRVRVLVAGGQQSNQSTGEPYNYYLVGAGQAGSNQHANLQQTDLADLKQKVLAKLATKNEQNTIPPQNGAFILRGYLDTYFAAAPEPGVKRVVVIVNNSDEFENFDFTHGPRVTAQQLRAQLQAKGVTLIVNTPPQLANRFGPGVLQQAAAQNYQDRDPKYMLLDLAAAGACTPQDETCQDPGLVIKLFGTTTPQDDNLNVGGILPGVVQVRNPRGELELSSPDNNLLLSTKILDNGELDNPQATLRVPLTATDTLTRFYVTPAKESYTFDPQHNYKADLVAKVYESARAAQRPAATMRPSAATTTSTTTPTNVNTPSGGNVVASGTQAVAITDELVLYRGVNALSSLYAEAQQGRVTASGWGREGAHASPLRHHITGTNFSIFTSWSLAYPVAAKFAIKPFFVPVGQPTKEEGAILQLRIDPAQTVKSPNIVINEQEVLVIGPIETKNIELVKRTDYFNDPTNYSLDNDGKRKAMARLRSIFHGNQWPGMPAVAAQPCWFVGERWGDLLRNQGGIEVYLVTGGVETPLLNGGVNNWSTDATGLLSLNLGRPLTVAERVKIRATYQNHRFEGTSTARHPVIYLNNNPSNLVIQHNSPNSPLVENHPIPNGINRTFELGARVEQSEVDVNGNRFSIDPLGPDPVEAELERVEFLLDGTPIPLWTGIAPERQNDPLNLGFYTKWTPTENRTYVFKPRAYLKDGTMIEDHKPLNIHVGAPLSPRSSAPLSAAAGQIRSDNSVAVYPNPFQETFTLAYDLPQADEVSVLLQPLTGGRAQPLLTDKKQPAGRQQFTVRSGGVAAGLYLLIVRGKHGYEQRQKLIKLP
ncbi:hypothetical protein IC235_06205 [Hymenobacter sp. BT664]|uniref:T9SS type A sorting domain-containing protein n=1 Tax=Hymenobacter montanus TaxID=2771359 RepID=A0A927BB44_9BACT|nr:hypothetical protein [Hymenobacter montanus]MBD2767482.1 hypothetical protein [Hymenobacter montanus]